MKLFLASSNSGKLREFRALARERPDHPVAVLDTLPGFSRLAAFQEDAPTFAENASGKALHYSRSSEEFVFADDSGLVVPALGNAPGVRSARYAGPGARDEELVRKLLAEMKGLQGDRRRARFICVVALARRGKTVAVFSDHVEGVIAEEPHGAGGFGYDPVFLVPPLGLTFAEIPAHEKNRLSHRGRAFRKLLDFLPSVGA